MNIRKLANQKTFIFFRTLYFYIKYFIFFKNNQCLTIYYIFHHYHEKLRKSH